MPMIVCELTECIHNREDRCSCTTIGVKPLVYTYFRIKKAICDTYLETPDEVKKKLENKKGGLNDINIR